MQRAHSYEPKIVDSFYSGSGLGPEVHLRPLTSTPTGARRRAFARHSARARVRVGRAVRRQAHLAWRYDLALAIAQASIAPQMTLFKAKANHCSNQGPLRPTKRAFQSASSGCHRTLETADAV